MPRCHPNPNRVLSCRRIALLKWESSSLLHHRAHSDDSYSAATDFLPLTGLWSLISAVQTPGAPTLSTSLNPQLSTLTISWPLPEAGWTLQENTNGLPNANWNDHPNPQDNGTIKYLIVSPPTGNRFYRLKR